MTIIIEETKEIEGLVFWYEGGYDVERVHKNGTITKIEPYHENGEMAPVVWFKVWRGDSLIKRINSRFVMAILYKEYA